MQFKAVLLNPSPYCRGYLRRSLVKIDFDKLKGFV